MSDPIRDVARRIIATMPPPKEKPGLKPGEIATDDAYLIGFLGGFVGTAAAGTEVFAVGWWWLDVATTVAGAVLIVAGVLGFFIVRHLMKQADLWD